MGKTLLVGPDFAIGSSLLETLDRSGLEISVALWYYSSDHENWFFTLASNRLDEVRAANAYGLVHNALEAAGFTYERTPQLMIFKMTDPFIGALRRTFSKSASVDGMRLGGQMSGPQFVEDALVYRIR